MSPKRVNKYPIAFRRMALERMKNCASVSALAEELGVHRTVLYHWQRQLEAGHDGTPTSAIRQLRKEVRDLKRVLAEKTLEAERHTNKTASNFSLFRTSFSFLIFFGFLLGRENGRTHQLSGVSRSAGFRPHRGGEQTTHLDCR